MSDNQLIWLVEGCLVAAFLLIVAVTLAWQAVVDRLRARRNRRWLAREMPDLEARSALTTEDRRWLTEMGWRP